MQVSAVDFIESPSLYLDKVDSESIIIVRDGRAIAVLAKPSNTPVSDSLLGLLADAGISCADDIKSLRTGI